MGLYSVTILKILIDRILLKCDQIFKVNNGKSIFELTAVARLQVIIKCIYDETGVELNTGTISTYFSKIRNCKSEQISIGIKYYTILRQFAHFNEVDNQVISNNNNSAHDKYPQKINSIYTEGDPKDPAHPEFPINHPSFPASPHYLISIPGFSEVWLKDESVNLTGTHKDRKALEIYLAMQNEYFSRLQRMKEENNGRPAPILHVSIISSGNEAYAIQTMFKLFGYPNLHVLLDDKMKTKPIVNNLKDIGCIVDFDDLSKKRDKEYVLNKTRNPEGVDWTTYNNKEKYSSNWRKFYDWLSYEILNLSPDICFIPCGTGDLFLNVLEFNKAEIEASNNMGSGHELLHDRRFFGHIEKLRNCSFIGASTKDPNSLADKLYTPFNSPLDEPFQTKVAEYISKGNCGKLTQVRETENEYLKFAHKYANKLGVKHEYSGIAGLAMFFKMKHLLDPNKKIVIVNTGQLRLFNDVDSQKRSLTQMIESFYSKLNLIT